MHAGGHTAWGPSDYEERNHELEFKEIDGLVDRSDSVGLAALVGGERWLLLLIPAAMLIWYGVGPMLSSGRN